MVAAVLTGLYLCQPVTPLRVSAAVSNASSVGQDEMYSQDNPKRRSLNPVMRDISTLKDATDVSMTDSRDFMLKYAERTYPEYTWTVINVVKMKDDRGEYIRGEAYSQQSLDVHMVIYDRNGEISDTFTKDVIERGNPMERWRQAYNELLKTESTALYPLDTVKAEISYAYFKENIPLIKLDAPFDPQDPAFMKALEISFPYGVTDAEKIAPVATELINTLYSKGYKATEYYIRTHPVNTGKKEVYVNWYIIPESLIGKPSFSDEIRNALLVPDNQSNVIKGTGKNGLLFDKLD